MTGTVNLVQIDTNTGVGTAIGLLPSSDEYGLSTGCTGTGTMALYATSSNGTVYQLDPSNGNVVQDLGVLFVQGFDDFILGTSILTEAGYLGVSPIPI